MTQDQSRRILFPYHYSEVDNPSDLLNQELEQLQNLAQQSSSISETSINLAHLDLSYNFTTTSEQLFSWEPKYFVDELTLNTCYQIRDFKWLSAEWVQNLKRLNLVNLSQITNRNIEFIVSKLKNLEGLYIHFCPQINIRVLLGALKEDRLQVLCIDSPQMPCQPNQYSGLITEEEWDLFRNRSLKKLLINSTNLSLDIIDYLRISFLNLENLIIDDSKYQQLRKSIVNPGSTDAKINIASNRGTKIILGRDFTIKNLLKHRYSKPFSDNMLKVMEQAYQQEREEDAAEEQRNPLCTI